MISKRITVADDDILKFELEDTKGLGWTIHCTMYKWTPSIYKSMLLAWGDLAEQLHEKGVETLYVYAEDSATYKFASMFGFTRTNLLGTGNNGKTYSIWEYRM